MNLDELAVSLHETSVEKGFWDEEVNIHFLLSKLALVHSEISEILEALRKQMSEEKIVEECVDVFIRLMDWYEGARNAGFVSSSFDEILVKKSSINKNRERKHGNLA